LRVHTWPLNDSALLQRRLCTVPVMTVASPDYLARTGQPSRVEDLAAHDLLTFGFDQPQSSWTLADARGRQHSVSFRPKLQASDVVMLKLLVLRGLGIAQLSHLLCNADVAAGRLVAVLPKYRAEAGVLSLLSPPRRDLSPAVRALVDF